MTKGSNTPLGAAQRLAALVLFGAVAIIPQVAVSDGGAEHQTWVRPVELGVSGSSIEHVVDGQRLFCYTGTLGALVTDGPNDYFLSNNHVLAKENEPDSALGFERRQRQRGRAAEPLRSTRLWQA
jgi:hypothetical protein